MAVFGKHIMDQFSISGYVVRMNGRVKSMGDLLDDSPENGSYFMEHSMPGSAQRPKSLYEGSGTRLPMNSSPPAMRVRLSNGI